MRPYECASTDDVFFLHSFPVTACSNSQTALKTLRAKKEDFDIVLSDVHMPDMDGFKLLELIQFELDLPVLMMSANSDSSVVLRGIIHGAVDYLLKPVRIEELRNIWQHVVRRIGSAKNSDDTPPSPSKRAKTPSTMSAKSEESDRNTESGGASKSRKKPASKKVIGKAAKAEAEKKEKENVDSGSTKKPRVVWSAELHAQFVTAVNQLGIDKAVPKRILDLMGVQGLTRENVASHLQKYRLYLKRLQGNSGSAAGGPGFMNVPTSTSLPQNRVNNLSFANGNGAKADDDWNDNMFRTADLTLPMSATDFLASDDFGDTPDSAFDPALLSPLSIDKVKSDANSLLEVEASEQMLNYFLQD